MAVIALLVVTIAGSGLGQADPPADALAPPNLLDAPVFQGKAVAGQTVSMTVPATIGAAPVTTGCQWQDGGTGLVGAAWADVAGATTCAGYAVPSSLNGHWLRGKVTASNSVGTASSSTYGSRVNGDLVFSTTRSSSCVNTQSRLRTTDSSGNGGDDLSPASICYSQGSPSVSPDGTRIAYNSSQGGVWVMNSDGTQQTQVSADGHEPSWSPDGSQIAFLRDVTGGSQIWVMNADGSAQQMILDKLVVGDPSHGGFTAGYHALDWGADNWIYFSEYQPTWYIYDIASQTWSLSTQIATCSQQTWCWQSEDLSRILPNGASKSFITTTNVNADCPAAPTGNGYCHLYQDPNIDASADRMVWDNGNGYLSPNSIFVADLGSGGVANVASALSTAVGYFPAISPDGTKMVAENGNPNNPAKVTDLPGFTNTVSLSSTTTYSYGFDWGTLTDPDPALPLGQTFGNELAVNAGDDADVSSGTGSYSTSVTDISIPGIDLPFDLTRSYNSLDTTVGDLGPGWQHPFGAKLTIATNGDVTARASDAQQFQFFKQADGSYRPFAGGTSTLTKLASTYELKTDVQTVYVFDLTGKLTAVKTPNNKQLTVAYDGSGKIDSVTDTVGRLIDFQTNGSGKISSVVLSDGRHVDYAYDGSGRLATVTDLRGKVTTYAYDGSSSRLTSILDPLNHWVVRNTYDQGTGRLVSQLDPRGNQTVWSWDPATQTGTITDQAGKTWKDVYKRNVLLKRADPLLNTDTYTYDRAFNPRSVLDARGKTRKMTYGAAANLLTSQAPATLGYVSSYTQNARNETVTATDERGNTTGYAYDTNGNRTSETLPGNRTTSYTIDPATGLTTDTSDPRGKTTHITYDAQGNKTSVTTPLGNKTTWTYDGFGRVLTTVSPRGNCSGCTAANFTTTYTYDNAGNVLTATDPLGNVTTNTYDDAGNLATVKNAAPFNQIWTYQYDEANHRTKEISPNTAVRETQYDSRGNVSAEIDPLGNKTTYTYDDAGRKLTTVSPRGNCGGCTPANFTTTSGYDANGNLTSVADPLGNQTTYVYDDLNRRTSMTDPRGKTTSYGYDGSGNLVSTTNALNKTASTVYNEVGWPTSTTDFRGKTTTNTYDAAGNRLSATTQLGNQTKWTYDDDGRVATKITPLGNCGGCTPANFTWTYTYDENGNLKTEKNPLNQQTQYTYDRDDRKATEVDANSHTTQLFYDNVGRLNKVTDPLSKDTTYGYDDVGNLTTRTDAKTHVTTYGFDLANRLTTLTLPGPTTGTTRVYTYGYDPNGNRTTKTDANGNATTGNPSDGITTYTFDRDDRLSQTSYSDGTPSVSATYDADGNRLTMTDALAAQEVRTYDDLNRVSTVTRGSDAFSYQYDENGAVTQRVYPDGTIVNLTLDNDNRLSTVAAGGVTTTYGYDADGNLLSTTLPSGNGYVESRTYDSADRLSEVKDVKGATTLSKFTVTVDPVGNPTRVDHVGTASDTYKYDAADRVTEACYKASGAACTKNTDPFVRFTYDDVGNRLTEKRGATTTTYSYNSADEMTAKGSTSYTYDQDGQQTAAGTRTFAWNVANQVASSTLSGTTVSYTYDGDNARAKSVVGSSTVNYLWDKNDGLPQLALERDGSNALLRRYVTGLDTVSETTSAGAFYFHYDNMGSAVNVTSATGVTQWTRQFEPFGVKRSETNNSGSAPVVPLQYTGEYSDATTSLYNLRARQYDPATGRFLSEDPAPAEITDPYVSAYLYVNSRSTVLVDPAGTFGCGPLSGACEFAAGVAGAVKDTVAGVKDLLTGKAGYALGQGLADAYYDNGGGWRGTLEAISYGAYALTAPIFECAEGIAGGDARKAGHGCAETVGLLAGPKAPRGLDGVVGVALRRIEASAGPESHFLRRHGAQTALRDQLRRATEGRRPDGTVGKPVDSSRFLTNTYQYMAIKIAYLKYLRNRNVNYQAVRFPFDVGEGYLKGGHSYRRTNKVCVGFGSRGQVVTAFPDISAGGRC